MTGPKRRRGIRAEEFNQRAAEFFAQQYPQVDEPSVLLGNIVQRAARVQLQQSESLVLRQFGLGYTAFSALYLLQVFGPLEAQTLAQALGISRQAVSTVVANLEKRSLITRTQGDDRRTFVLELTDEGRSVGADALEHQARLAERWVDCLSDDERRSLLGMLERVMVHARDIEPDDLELDEGARA